MNLKQTVAFAGIALLTTTPLAVADVSTNMTRLADGSVGAAADWTPTIIGLTLLGVGLAAIFGAIAVIKRNH